MNLLDREALAREAVHLAVFTSAIHDLAAPAESLRARVAIEGFWKLLVPGPRTAETDAADPANVELYDLKRDPLESRNLAEQEPKTVQRLRESLDGWWKASAVP